MSSFDFVLFKDGNLKHLIIITFVLENCLIYWKKLRIRTYFVSVFPRLFETSYDKYQKRINTSGTYSSHLCYTYDSYICI